MKIILFIDYLCSGGAQRQLIELARLIKASISDDVIVAVYHDDNILKPSLDEEYIHFQVIQGSQKLLLRISSVLGYFKQEKPDVVISYLDSPNIIACLCHLFYPKFKLFVSERNTSQAYTLRERIRFYLFRHANYIIANSFSQQSFITRHSPKLSAKLRVITNCVDTDKYLSHASGIVQQPVRILTVARISEQKNVPAYLTSLKILRKQGVSFKAKWYGRYDDKRLYMHCLSLINEYDLQGVFEFCGESTDLLPIYQDADLFCLPSLFEGFPNVVCEAMSVGLPIACSDVCDNPIIVEDGVNGVLFNPYEPQSIADGLVRCIHLVSERKEGIAAINRDKMIKICSKEAFINHYKELLYENPVSCTN